MKTTPLGRIGGAVGLVLVFWALFVWLISSSKVLAGIHVGVGLLLLAFWVFSNFRQMGAFATSRGTFFIVLTLFGTLLLLLAVVFGNYFVIKKGKTWDVTKNKLHTLAPDTTQSLNNLKSELNVLAFFSPGEANSEAARELLGKYERESKNFKVEWVDPVKDPARVRKFGVRRDGGHRLVVLFRPAGRPADAAPTEQRVAELTEEALTNAIVKVTRGAEKTVYFVVGHGEADPDDTKSEGLSELKKRMENEGLRAAKLQIATVESIAADAAAVVVAGPQVEWQPAEVDRLKQYLEQGGRAFVAVEPQRPIAALGALLKAWGIEAEDAIVVDPLSRLFNAGVLVPVVQEYGESDIVRDFRLNTAFPTARPLTILHDVMTVQAKPLAMVLQSAWAETNLEAQPYRRDDTEKGGPFPIVATATKDTKAALGKRADEARLVVAGDRDFFTNQYHLAFGNEDFYLNCLSWLVEQTERITIRPRSRDASRLFLTEAQSAAIFVGAIEVPVLILVAGLWVWLARRSR